MRILNPLKEILKSSLKSEGNTGLIFTHKMGDKIGERVICIKRNGLLVCSPEEKMLFYHVCVGPLSYLYDSHLTGNISTEI
jgi:hypothetical protein